MCWPVSFLCALLWLPVGAGGQAAKVSVARWPGDRQAAISLTFDDAMDTHLDIVGPILKKHRLKGTFYVSTGRESWRKRLPGWKQLAAEGHELGGHTVRHPCLLDRITPHAQEYTPEMMEAEVRDSARAILDLAGSRRGLTFAYPCGNMSFGPPSEQPRNAALYLRYIADHYFGARWYGTGGPQDPDALSVLTVPDLGSTAGRDFMALLAMAQETIRNGHWGVYCFHGVGGQWLSVSGEALDELAAFLEKHAEIWTATFGDVLRYTQERRSLGIEATEAGSNALKLALRWPMDPRIYDLPLTLKVELPAGARSAQARIDGKPLETARNGSAAVFEVPPQTRQVSLEWEK